MNTDGYKCRRISCGNVQKNYSRHCQLCDGEKTLEFEENLFLRRFLVNILGIVSLDKIIEIAEISGITINDMHDYNEVIDDINNLQDISKIFGGMK